jgi:hypothetical protein
VCDKLAGVLDHKLILGNVLGSEKAVATPLELGLAEQNRLGSAALKGHVLTSGRMQMVIVRILRICSLPCATSLAEDWVTFTVQLHANASLALFLLFKTRFPRRMTSAAGELESTRLCCAIAEPFTQERAMGRCTRAPV